MENICVTLFWNKASLKINFKHERQSMPDKKWSQKLTFDHFVLRCAYNESDD